VCSAVSVCSAAMCNHIAFEPSPNAWKRQQAQQMRLSFGSQQSAILRRKCCLSDEPYTWRSITPSLVCNIVPQTLSKRLQDNEKNTGATNSSAVISSYSFGTAWLQIFRSSSSGSPSSEALGLPAAPEDPCNSCVRKNQPQKNPGELCHSGCLHSRAPSL
jgi:hypothetical protein